MISPKLLNVIRSLKAQLHIDYDHVVSMWTIRLRVTRRTYACSSTRTANDAAVPHLTTILEELIQDLKNKVDSGQNDFHSLGHQAARGDTRELHKCTTCNTEDDLLHLVHLDNQLICLRCFGKHEARNG